MDDQRKFVRWNVNNGTRAIISRDGMQEEVELLDVSAGGMKVSFPKSVSENTSVQGQFRILPQLGPFFVRGKVKRVEERNGAWLASVVFDQVRTIPLTNM